MRIMHVASKDLPVPAIRGGAVQLWIDKVSRTLAERENTEVAVVSPWDPRLPEKENNGGVEHRRIRFSKPYVRVCRKWLRIDPWGYPWRVAREAADWRADIVHLHGGGSLWLFNLRKRLPQTPVVIHLHNDPRLELHKWPWRDWSNVWFVACSRFIADVAGDALEISPERLRVVWNGADVEDFQPWWRDISARQRQRSVWSIPEAAQVLLFCGRVAPEKGPHWLARQAAPLMAANPDLWCVFVGDYHPQPVVGKEEWCATYREICDVLAPYRERVLFTGALPPAAMPAAFAAGDVFVGPAQGDEGFGMVYVEAMASGLPVIACPRGGIPEFVDGEVGSLITDELGLARELRRFSASAELRRTVGEAGRQRAVDSFSWQAVARGVAMAYEEIQAARLG